MRGSQRTFPMSRYWPCQGFWALSPAGVRVLRRRCGFVAGVSRHRRNLAVLWGRGLRLAVLWGQHLPVIRCGCSRLAIRRGSAWAAGRKSWAGWVKPGAGRIRSGEVRRYRRAVRHTVGVLRRAAPIAASSSNRAPSGLEGRAMNTMPATAAGQRDQSRRRPPRRRPPVARAS